MSEENQHSESPAQPLGSDDSLSLMPERDELWAKFATLSPRLCAEALALAGKLEMERNEARAWIKRAAPVMESAICIAMEVAPDRIWELPDCRGIMETCPIEWARMPHLRDNAEPSHGPRD